jgi:hypothetical protein
MKLKKEEANELRLIANEIMRRLYESKHTGQLEILTGYGKACVDLLKSKATEEGEDE